MNSTDKNLISILTVITSLTIQRNNTSNYGFESEPKLSFRVVFIICCYSVIMIISIFGNLLVCNVVIRNRNMQSATYVFITNLALSDLMMTVLNIPFNVARLLLNDWPFGSFMCSFVPLMQVTSVYVSTFTMTCIAVDRYRIVSKPLRPRLKPLKAIQAMICVWLLAILLSVPHAVFNRIKKVFTYRPLSRCVTEYPEHSSRWITIMTVTTQYILPLSVTGVLYCLIMERVWSRHVLGVVTEAQIVSQARSKRKTIKMLICVVILFALCWMPLNVFHLLNEFDATDFIYKFSTPPTTIYFICHWWAMSSVCYNPFIYCYLNEHFRSGAASCIHCLTNMARKINTSLRSGHHHHHHGRATELVTEFSNQNSMVGFKKCCSKPCSVSSKCSVRNASRRAAREVNPLVKSYYVPKSPGKGNLLILKAKFYSVPDLNVIGQSQNDTNKLEESEVRILDLNVNGRVVYHLKKCSSCEYL